MKNLNDKDKAQLVAFYICNFNKEVPNGIQGKWKYSLANIVKKSNHVRYLGGNTYFINHTLITAIKQWELIKEIKKEANKILINQ